MMAAQATAVPAGGRNAAAPAAAPDAIAAAGRPSAAPAGFAAHHPVPAGFLRLVCPPGAEAGPISAAGYSAGEAFREHGPGRGRWLIDLPAEAAVPLLHNGGFHLYDPAAPR
jgi:hypothetical protein